jgi:hypothetical protein
MEAALEGTRRPEASDGGGYPDAVWGVREIMAKDILPADPEERRRRRRLYALRALERLGLLGEENLIPTLARRPELRWLADEGGARWNVLAQLGRIREPEAFEETVAWALENRPFAEEVKTYICCSRSDAIWPPSAQRGRDGWSRNGSHGAVRAGGNPKRSV